MTSQFTEQELWEREEIERANERAIQVALQSSFEEFKEEIKVRSTADPWLVEQMNERALREAMQASMYESRSTRPPVSVLALILHW